MQEVHYPDNEPRLLFGKLDLDILIQLYWHDQCPACLANLSNRRRRCGQSLRINITNTITIAQAANDKPDLLATQTCFDFDLDS